MQKRGKKFLQPSFLQKQKRTEYEKAKYRRMQENDAILAAQGFKHIQASLMASVQQKHLKGKRVQAPAHDQDEDYNPSDDYDEGDYDDDDYDDDDDENGGSFYHEMGGPGRKNIQKEGATGSRSHTPVSTNASNQLQVDPSTLNGNNEQGPMVEGHVNDCASSPIKKKRRGITRGIGHGKRLKPGEKFDVVVPEELLRVVGPDAQALITEAGIIVRKYAPLQVKNWKSIEQHEKEKLWGWLQEKFQLQNVQHVRKAIFQQLNRMYRQWRHRLYKEHFLPHKTEENPLSALEHQPVDIKAEDWEYLCNYFASEEYKKVSTRNQKSRSTQEVSHTTGTVSYSRISYDAATGNMMDQVELWRKTHFSEKKQDWVDKRSKELHDEMVERLSKSQEEGATPMTAKEVCLDVLKPKSGYVRGLGPGPKPSPSSSQKTSRAELEEALRGRAEAENQNRMLREEMEILKANQAEMCAKQEQMTACNEETQALLRQLMKELHSRGITQYSSNSSEGTDVATPRV